MPIGLQALVEHPLPDQTCAAFWGRGEGQNITQVLLCITFK